jgi:hypothetical protein
LPGFVFSIAAHLPLCSRDAMWNNPSVTGRVAEWLCSGLQISK